MENSFPISFSKCAARIHLIGQLSDQSNFTCFYSPKCPLSNGENRSSLSCSVRQLFKKHQSLLYFENDISYTKTQKIYEKKHSNKRSSTLLPFFWSKINLQKLRIIMALTFTSFFLFTLLPFTG